MDWGRSEDKLRALAAQGLSARQIAAQLGGVTRNAVIGQMKRRGIVLAGNRGGQRDTVQALPDVPPAAPMPSGQPEPILSGMAAHHSATPAADEESRGSPVSTKDLRWSGQCKFPVTNDAPFMHCGAPAKGVYCDSHHARMYSAPRARVVA